jgi:hypothetical protein
MCNKLGSYVLRRHNLPSGRRLHLKKLCEAHPHLVLQDVVSKGGDWQVKVLPQHL